MSISEQRSGEEGLQGLKPERDNDGARTESGDGLQCDSGQQRVNQGDAGSMGSLGQ